jgi:hypothetical protein
MLCGQYFAKGAAALCSVAQAQQPRSALLIVKCVQGASEAQAKAMRETWAHGGNIGALEKRGEPIQT